MKGTTIKTLTMSPKSDEWETTECRPPRDIRLFMVSTVNPVEL
jgi:hypothetical protein